MQKKRNNDERWYPGIRSENHFFSLSSNVCWFLISTNTNKYVVQKKRNRKKPVNLVIINGVISTLKTITNYDDAISKNPKPEKNKKKQIFLFILPIQWLNNRDSLTLTYYISINIGISLRLRLVSFSSSPFIPFMYYFSLSPWMCDCVLKKKIVNLWIQRWITFINKKT